MAAQQRSLEDESDPAQPDAEPTAGEDGWVLPEEPLRLRPVPALEPVAARLDDGWGLEAEPSSPAPRPRPRARTETSPPVDKGRFSLQALAGGELGRVGDEPDFLSDFLSELLGPNPGAEGQELVRLLQRVRCLIGPR